MGKLKPLQQRRIVRILESNGFKKARSSKHITFKKKIESGQILTTWVPHGNEITIFVIQHIIRQTGKPRGEFC